MCHYANTSSTALIAPSVITNLVLSKISYTLSPFELIIQKSVELGVYDIIPVEMKRSIVKLKEGYSINLFGEE